MENFKKVFKIGSIAIVSIAIFLAQAISNSVYGQDLPRKNTSLRKPLCFRGDERIFFNRRFNNTAQPKDKIPYPFHSNVVLAVKGLNSLKELIDVLPEPLKVPVHDSLEFIRVYTGVCPEVDIKSLLLQFDKPLRDNLVDEIRKNPNFIVVGDKVRGWSIINIKAARQVMENNPDYFPENCYENSEQCSHWLKDSIDKWRYDPKKIDSSTKDIEIRYGLLSGYPRKAVDRFILYKEAQEKLKKNISRFEPLDRLFIFEMIGPILYNAEFTQMQKLRFKELLDRHAKGILNEEEIFVLVNSHIVYSLSVPGFKGVSESDDEWVIDLDRILITANKLSGYGAENIFVNKARFLSTLNYIETYLIAYANFKVMSDCFPNFTSKMHTIITQALDDIGSCVIASCHPNSSLAKEKAMPFISDVDDFIIIHRLDKKGLDMAQKGFKDLLISNFIRVSQEPVWISEEELKNIIDKKNKNIILNPKEKEILNRAGLAIHSYYKVYLQGELLMDVPYPETLRVRHLMRRELRRPLPIYLEGPGHDDKKIEVRDQLFENWDSLSVDPKELYDLQAAIKKINYVIGRAMMDGVKKPSLEIKISRPILDKLIALGYVGGVGNGCFSANWAGGSISFALSKPDPKKKAYFDSLITELQSLSKVKVINNWGVTRRDL